MSGKIQGYRLESSQILVLGYDRASSQLYAGFANGDRGEYLYFDVPEDIFEKLIATSVRRSKGENVSVGQQFVRLVKGKRASDSYKFIRNDGASYFKDVFKYASAYNMVEERISSMNLTIHNVPQGVWSW